MTPSTTSHHTSRPETAPALWRTAMPTPSPSTADPQVYSRAQSSVDGSPLVSPTASPPRPAIATELYVSINTVRTHCRAIDRKLGVGDRHAAVQIARDHRLL